jgi:cytochrome c biogenesis protein CcdA
MDRDTVSLIIGIAIVLAILYIAIKFIGSVLGFVVDHPLLIVSIAVIAAIGVAVYFAGRQGDKRNGS